jgi:hypothetical protein
MFPGVIMPVPPLKTPVRLANPPAVIEVGLAVKLVIVAAVEPTVTGAVLVAVTPAEFVTVRV